MWPAGTKKLPTPGLDAFNIRSHRNFQRRFQKMEKTQSIEIIFSQIKSTISKPDTNFGKV